MHAGPVISTSERTHLVLLCSCIRPRRRHQPLCDLQVSYHTRKQKRSVARLHTSTTTNASASASHTVTQRHCTYSAPLRHCIRPRRRHQPLRNLQVPIQTREQKRSVAILHTNTTHASTSASHTATERHCTHIVPLRRCIRPRRRHQPLCNLQVSSLTRDQKRSVAPLQQTPHTRLHQHHTQLHSGTAHTSFLSVTAFDPADDTSHCATAKCPPQHAARSAVSPYCTQHHTRVCISIAHIYTAALHTPRYSPSLHSTPPTTPATVRLPSVLPYTHTEAQWS
jgi:hypothetical protein